MNRSLTLLLLGVVTLSNSPLARAVETGGAVEDRSAGEPQGSGDWSSFITPAELQAKLHDPKLVIIDVRSPEEYAAGHIPGAINLPGAEWRTPPAEPGSGKLGQQIFRKADGTVDVERYEKFLSAAGVKPEHDIVVYGNYAGKADGSLPAALLLKLGHDRVAFLDGVGLDEWRNAGYAASNEPQRLPPSTYVAKPRLERLWSYDEVRKNLNNPNVIILDSRSEAEFLGQELRGNKRGGHIPGAQLLSSDDLLDKQSHKTISVEAARSRIEKMLPDKSKTVVVYCQSGTRCSLKELVLKDLGYKNVVLYDGSWQEWSSKEDAPVERP